MKRKRRESFLTMKALRRSAEGMVRIIHLHAEIAERAEQDIHRFSTVLNAVPAMSVQASAAELKIK